MSQPFPSPEVKQKIKQIRTRVEHARSKGYRAEDFEYDLLWILRSLFPYSVLPNVRLFSPSRYQDDFGFEMDALLHFQHAGSDWIVVIEAKNQPIAVSGDNWSATYGQKKKSVNTQIDRHIQTLREYLRPVDANTELRFLEIVVSSDRSTETTEGRAFRNAERALVAFQNLPKYLDLRFNFRKKIEKPGSEVLRVTQSQFLNLLRMNLAVPELGHPEFANAIRYVERCRRLLDESIYREFDPKPERWVINGSAGMGKSVLLAYTAAVLTSKHELKVAIDTVAPYNAEERLQKVGFEGGDRPIGIIAMSERQLGNLRSMYNYFVETFRKGDEGQGIVFQTPQFIRWRNTEDFESGHRPWGALLVDEGHDLPGVAQQRLADLYREQAFYLVVALDRHQKLRLTRSNAPIIEGIDFTNRSTRLRRNYRNPGPINIAALAIMFRWFGKQGQNYVPTVSEMEAEFGLTATRTGGGNQTQVTLKSDLHPANSWSHTVALFPNVRTTYESLTREKLGESDVLWVRFCEEDPDFDYEQLSRVFTYHNCRSREADKISDKYIKGQDFPIVILEGFPRFMDQFETKEESAKMRTFRRELYLCASRATTFLYFVANPLRESEESKRIKEELESLVASLSYPANPEETGTREWRFTIPRLSDTRNLSDFTHNPEGQEETKPKAAPETEQQLESDPPAPQEEETEFDFVQWYEIPVFGPMTLSEFATLIELPESQLEEDLLDKNKVVTGDNTLDIKTMRQLAANYNTAVVLDGTEELDQDFASSPGKKRTEVVDEGEREKSLLAEEQKTEATVIRVHKPIIVRDLANLLGVKPFKIIQELMDMKVFANLNQSIDPAVAIKLSANHGFLVEIIEDDIETEHAP